MICTQQGYKFNESGEMIPIDVYVVWGSPASGKTSYVRRHKEPGDLIVDLDDIKRAISMSSKTETPIELLDIAISIRDHLYEIVRQRKVTCKNVWIIAGLPTKKQREEVKKLLNPTKWIHIDTDMRTCIKQAHEDTEREDKTLQKVIISRYFQYLEV